MRFYGREEELQVLKNFLLTVQKKKISQMVTVIGRRRVGKTTLILKAFEKAEIPVFYFFVERQSSKEEIIASWLDMICRAYHIEFPPALNTIADVISYLMSLSEKQECVCIIDECQEFNAVSPQTWSQLQKVWDLKKNESRMLLIMSGSIISAMEDIFGNRSQPLYGRPSCQILLEPFTPALIKEIIKTENSSATNRDLLMVYAMTGGVPKYIELLCDADSLTEEKALDYFCSLQSAWFRAEGEIYLSNEFKAQAPVYRQILRSIADGATKWNEIESRIDDSVQLSPYLSRLEKFGIIQKVRPILQEKGRKTTQYRITDQYFLFWLTFVTPLIAQSLAQAHDWKRLKQYCQERLDTFLGKSLERWFIESIKHSGQWEIVGSWWDKKGLHEIDVVAINSAKQKICFNEVKLNTKKYNEAKLKLNAEAFLEVNPKLKEYKLSINGLSLENV